MTLTCIYLFKKEWEELYLTLPKIFSKANIKYIQFYNDKTPSKYITYLDANTLYGWAISQYWPHGEFNWLNHRETDEFDVNSIENSSSNWYILEVDPEYSDESDELHNDYPLAPENLEISYDTLSNYCNTIANKFDIKIRGANKLIPNLGSKSKYLLHYKNFQLYILLGMMSTCPKF